MTDNDDFTMSDYVMNQLAGFYAGSKRLTVIVCEDIADFMANNRLDKPSDFDKALSDFREKNDKRDYCPSLNQLRNYFPQKQDLGAKYDLFVNCVIRDGWKRAVSENEWARGMLNLMDYDPNIEYSSLEIWQIKFCQILHHGEGPAAAYAYAADNAMPADKRWWYKKRAEFFAKGSLEEQQSYFSWFRFQQPTGLAIYGEKRNDDIVDVDFEPAPF